MIKALLVAGTALGLALAAGAARPGDEAACADGIDKLKMQLGAQ